MKNLLLIAVCALFVVPLGEAFYFHQQNNSLKAQVRSLQSSNDGLKAQIAQIQDQQLTRMENYKLPKWMQWLGHHRVGLEVSPGGDIRQAFPLRTGINGDGSYTSGPYYVEPLSP
jgi:hypothetical protein